MATSDKQIASFLNKLYTVNLGAIASNQDLVSVVEDYFVKDDHDDGEDSFFDDFDDEEEFYEGKVSVIINTD